MHVLVLNCGSSSLKFQLLDTQRERALFKGNIERIGTGGVTHTSAIKSVLEDITGTEVHAVGHRVVHGGSDLVDATLIDSATTARIEACVPLAPLHNPANLEGIRAAQTALPGVPHVAVFDTAFHARIPRRARTYAVDAKLAQEHNIRRFGFHGPSHAFVTQQAANFLQRPLSELRLISCHLGSGASAAAVEFGQCVETSMGMTPLEGLAMGTRSGDLDPGVVLQMVRALGVDTAEQQLNRHSGLVGLSGLSNDLRDIETAAAEGHEGARLAISVFAHRVRKYIGAYAAVMGGVDAVIFTAGIGENSVTMRRRILQRFEHLGLLLSEDRNHGARISPENPVVNISEDRSRTKALVIATNEELMIARETVRIVDGHAAVRTPAPIPIAVSARHVHLNRETFERLFGAGAQLTKHKDISQPGQFASQERVNLVGPRGHIDSVRILGPLRGRNQIEISRTDEFKLGVDAPIRRSGQTKDSAPITLEGPHSTVHLKEGLVCAWRHIHMTPQDAESYGVVAGDIVEVAIDGGPRDLTFGDVLVRVKSTYLLEMHIDTDEANAAELAPRQQGELIYAPAGDATASLRKRRASSDVTGSPQQ